MKKNLIILVSIIVLVAIFFSINQTEENEYMFSTKDRNVSSATERIIKTYSNEEFGFSFNYPSDWSLITEKPIIGKVNNIPLRIRLENSTSGQRIISIWVYANEPPLYIYETTHTQNVTVNDKQQLAYIFPNGYECFEGSKDLPKGETCPFYTVPVKQGLFEYRISGKNSVLKNDDLDLLKSFHIKDF